MGRAEYSVSVTLLGLVLLATAPARAEDACAKFQEPLAYNACLAKQGPEWHGTRGVPVPADADAPKRAGGWRGPGRVRSAARAPRRLSTRRGGDPAGVAGAWTAASKNFAPLSGAAVFLRHRSKKHLDFWGRLQMLNPRRARRA
jgi:hypothetical protein